MAASSKARSTKLLPDPPDLPGSFDPAVQRLDDGALWDGVEAGDAVEVAGTTADVVLRETVWDKGDLSGRRLTGFRCRDVRFVGCDLSGTVLDGCDLTRVVFAECRMTGIVLSGGTLSNVHVSDCRADLANFRMARADYLRIEGTSLRAAEFYQARLTASALLDCDLSEANFTDATLADVDLHGSTVAAIHGALSLGGANIAPDQLISLAGALAAATGVHLTDRRS